MSGAAPIVPRSSSPPAAPRRLRRHLPVLSPLSARALARGAAALLRPRAELAELLAALTTTFHADGALLTDSGTTALRLAIETGIRSARAPHIVALPAFSCYDVATAACGAGAGIILYDVDPDTLAPDPASLDDAFRRGAALAVIAPLYGIPVDWDALEACAATHGALLIEDAAQGHGAAWRGRPLGALGRLSVLSFGRGKGWTGGAGGALLWRDHPPPEPPAASTAHAAVLRTLAGAAAQWAFGRPALYGIPAALPWLGLGETHYREPAVPSAMAPACAAIALATHHAAAHAADRRRVRARALSARLQTVTHVRPPVGAQPGFLRLPVRLTAYDAAVAGRALRHLGVATTYPTTLADLPAVRDRLATGHSPTPGADTLVRELITLPTHDDVDDATAAAIVAGLARA